MNTESFHSRKDWENPGVTQVNRAPDHTAWGAYESAAQAAACDRGASRWTLSLDGDYLFRLYDSPDLVDAFYEPGYNASQFKPVRVPGCWETQSFGKPIYRNVAYPWPLEKDRPGSLTANAAGKLVYDPPFTPKENPTGCYLRTFTLPEGWLGRNVFLRMEGVEAACHIWINGRPVGYMEDSKLPAEFDITAHLHAGGNLLAMMVTRFASSSWLEDQDYWSLSGIHRSVRLIAKPHLRIQDWFVRAEIVPGGGGRLRADIMVSRVPGFADARVRFDLVGPDGSACACAESGVASSGAFAPADGPLSGAALIDITLPHVKIWNPDTPNLYTCIITLIGPDGTVLDIESEKAGFKSVEIRQGVVHLNGRRLIVRGVNRHEHGPDGRTVPAERMLEEIRQMKRMNINAVRTCHYPDSEAWYDLCDRYGLLVLCECNLETHGLAGMLSNDPGWSQAYLERAVRMVVIHKNHACIYGWSLGNESGHGPNHAAMYGWIKEYDPGRLCQYESANPGHRISDVRGQMYASQQDILGMLTDPRDTRPVILVEFLYQILNSGGGAFLFCDLVERYERFQGGFVWDWQDKTLPAFDGKGKHVSRLRRRLWRTAFSSPC